MKVSRSIIQSMPARTLAEIEARKQATAVLEEAESLVSDSNAELGAIRSRDNGPTDMSEVVGVVVESNREGNSSAKPYTTVEADFTGPAPTLHKHRFTPAHEGADTLWTPAFENTTSVLYQGPYRIYESGRYSPGDPHYSKYTEVVKDARSEEPTYYVYQNKSYLGFALSSSSRWVARAIGGWFGPMFAGAEER